MPPQEDDSEVCLLSAFFTCKNSLYGYGLVLAASALDLVRGCESLGRPGFPGINQDFSWEA
jgi:hypothetical protein